MTLTQVSAISEGIIEHMVSPQGWGGYCEVPSATKPSKKYRVYFNARFYSTSCNCDAGQHSQDCGHRLAVDRHFDSRREQLQRDDEHTGLMTNCFCPDHAKWAPNREGGCKHMKEFNEQMRKLQAFQQAWHALDFRSEAQRAARREAYCVDFAIYG